MLITGVSDTSHILPVAQCVRNLSFEMVFEFNLTTSKIIIKLI